MNRAYAAAFRKGQEAARKGSPPEACPYHCYSSSGGFARAFRRHWMDGYNETPKPSAAPARKGK